MSISIWDLLRSRQPSTMLETNLYIKEENLKAKQIKLQSKNSSVTNRIEVQAILDTSWFWVQYRYLVKTVIL